MTSHNFKGQEAARVAHGWHCSARKLDSRVRPTAGPFKNQWHVVALTESLSGVAIVGEVHTAATHEQR